MTAPGPIEHPRGGGAFAETRISACSSGGMRRSCIEPCPLWRDLMEARCTIEAARAADRLLGRNRRSLAFRAGSFAAEEESWDMRICVKTTPPLDLASGAVIDLGSSWHLHAGRGAVIRAAFYGTDAVAIGKQGWLLSGFHAERFTRTSRVRLCEPPDEWGGRVAVDWARRLKSCRGYDPGIEQILEVAQALDAIYEHAR
jgi:hypothetical protein